MIKVDKVTRVDKVSVLVEISVGNVIVVFRKHATEKKLVEMSRMSMAQVYDRHNTFIPRERYIKVLKMAYAILYAKPKEVKKEVVQQLDLDV